MNELIFNGVNFTTFDAYYATSNFLDGAAKDYTSVSVLGRSGDLQISNNRYKNITVKVRVYVRSNMEQNIRAMRSYLESVNGYARLELSDQPNEYRIGLFKDMFAPKPYDRNVGAVELTFDCKPQRYLKSGEVAVTISESSLLENPTLFDSKPLIRCYGSGSLTINSQTITVASNPYEYVDIDCDIMDAFYGANNANQYVSFNTDFVVLRSGTNSITHDMTNVEITPRWYEV